MRLLLSVLLLACSDPTLISETNAPLRPVGKLVYEKGPLATKNAEYRLPASIDPDILADQATEIWAVVHTPDPLPDSAAPLLVFLHGNHSTCRVEGTSPAQDSGSQYTDSGTCGEGMIPVPNHRGYDYMAERLASWGYVVVSINANRAITAGSGTQGDWGFNLARGRLVLKHLALLSQWNAGTEATPDTLGFSFAGKLDFAQVGLMGHSRGGEGVRAALAQYQDEGSEWPTRIVSPLTIRAMLEIGPVDGQTDRVLTPHGVAWAVIAPSCDGDVSTLEGLDVYERLLLGTDDGQPKMAVAVWGANHNFFNTEWQRSDAWSCPVPNPIFQDDTNPAGSFKQQQAGLMVTTAFFRTFVGAGVDGASVWNSDFDLLSEVDALARFERAYEYRGDATASVLVSELTNVGQVMVQNATVEPSDMRRAVLLVTPGDGTNTSVDIALPDAARAATFTAAAIGFRIARARGFDGDAPNIAVQLLDAAGVELGRVPLADYVELGAGDSGVLLANARIWLSEFGSVSLTDVATLRLLWLAPSLVPLMIADARVLDAALMPAPAPPSARVEHPAPIAVEVLPEVYDTAAVGDVVESSVPFGFRAQLHEVYADGVKLDARVVIEGDGSRARIIGNVPAQFEIRYGSNAVWQVTR